MSSGLHDQLTDFIDGSLPPPQAATVAARLTSDPETARETEEIRQMLGVLHRLPRREPVLDIWAELAPKVAAFREEERLNVVQRLRLRGCRFLSNFASGAILFTQAFAMNTQRQLQKYVLHDALLAEDA